MCKSGTAALQAGASAFSWRRRKRQVRSAHAQQLGSRRPGAIRVAWPGDWSPPAPTPEGSRLIAVSSGPSRADAHAREKRCKTLRVLQSNGNGVLNLNGADQPLRRQTTWRSTVERRKLGELARIGRPVQPSDLIGVRERRMLGTGGRASQEPPMPAGILAFCPSCSQFSRSARAHEEDVTPTWTYIGALCSSTMLARASAISSGSSPCTNLRAHVMMEFWLTE